MKKSTLQHSFRGDRLKNDLWHQINSGLINVGTPILPERKLTEIYKISYLTVRKVIKEFEEQGILKRVQGKGTFLIKQPKLNKKTPLSVILDSPGSLSKEKNPLNWFIFVDILTGITEECDRLDLPVKLVLTEKKYCFAQKHPVIIVGSNWNSSDIQELEEAKIPYVVVNPRVNCYPCHRITCDDALGTYQATAHLINLGFRKIAYLGPKQDNSRFLPRYQGFISALSEWSLEPEDPIVEESGSSLNSYTTTFHYLEHKPPPEAIIAASDLRAIGAMEALRKKGLKIPADVAVVGFDDIEEAASCQPPLTTIAKCRKEMGREAVKFVFEWFQTPEKTPVSKVLKPKLIIRDSCGANIPKPKNVREDKEKAKV